MDEAINGLVELEHDSPNQRNEMWAQRLARTALAARQNITVRSGSSFLRSFHSESLPLLRQGCKIPTDVVAMIAEILTGSRDLETLARLNVASNELHEGTLPVLYETVTFTDERALRHAFRKLPAEWRYSKFVFVTETTLPQLQFQQQYHSRTQTSGTTRAIFHRLTAMGLARPTSPASSFGSDRDRQLVLTLYRPFSFTSLLPACLPPDESEKGPVPEESLHVCQLLPRVDLSGTGIIPEKKMSTALEGWHVRWSGTDFAVELPGEVDDVGVEETLRTVMDHLALYSSSKLVVEKTTRKGISVHFKIKCAASVWEEFVELAVMKAYLTSIASLYHQHWSQYDQEDTSLFLQLEARATKIDRDWIRKFNLVDDPGRHLNHQEWHGAAQYGWNGARDDDVDPEERWQHDLAARGQGGANLETDFLPGSGFEMILSRALMWRDEHQHGEQFWSRGYLACLVLPHQPTKSPKRSRKTSCPKKDKSRASENVPMPSCFINSRSDN
ncbi:hypothetical protein QFC22_004941 [Naganishia vaughanmartiniae]|uniref:Uncharacterized protein n=1 Tax=Naganishia vaughanmartiniae TaxID=1424756 RepID=A0ACC2WXC9_9TREE|nr:hypothetical protein QFC22_004941 [Naganishia vaughanmartiniae]